MRISPPPTYPVMLTTFALDVLMPDISVSPQALVYRCYECDDEHCPKAPTVETSPGLHGGSWLVKIKSTSKTLTSGKRDQPFPVGSHLAVQEGDSKKVDILTSQRRFAQEGCIWGCEEGSVEGTRVFTTCQGEVTFPPAPRVGREGHESQFKFVAPWGTIWPLARGCLSPISSTNFKKTLRGHPSANAQRSEIPRLVERYRQYCSCPPLLSLPPPAPFSILVHDTNNVTFTANNDDTGLTSKEHLVAAPGGTGIPRRVKPRPEPATPDNYESIEELLLTVALVTLVARRVYPLL
ncbi:hypothetical protein BKA70DRAFT_1395962 [Coprinopsis sp. MPI-PUGE-AT-0042]|nr:hypothetical protein BKA70DRAFT_1395962 [Coprinopsis sp. MPI-PUGE-AT-0042]